MPKSRNGERAQARSSGLVPNLAPSGEVEARCHWCGGIERGREALSPSHPSPYFAFLAVACLMRVHVARGGAHHVFVVQGL